MRWESIIQRAFNMCGLEIHRTLPGAEYVQCLPFPYSTYHPWFEPWFQQIYAEIEDHTLVKPDRCYMLHKFCLHSLHFEGDMAECGVYRGGTAYLLAQTTSEQA